MSSFSFLDPLLPNLIVDIAEHPDRWVSSHFMDEYTSLNTTGDAGDQLKEQYSFQISFLVSLKQGLEIPFNFLFGVLTVR